VVLSGANDLSGLMEITGGSLVIADAGLLTRGALTVDGTGAVLDLGVTARVCRHSGWGQAQCKVGV
jgi:hypothetical protein